MHDLILAATLERIECCALTDMSHLLHRMAFSVCAPSRRTGADACGTQHAVLAGVAPEVLTAARFTVASAMLATWLRDATRAELLGGAELGQWLFTDFALHKAGLETTMAARSCFLMYLNIEIVSLLGLTLARGRKACFAAPVVRHVEAFARHVQSKVKLMEMVRDPSGRVRGVGQWRCSVRVKNELVQYTRRKATT